MRLADFILNNIEPILAEWEAFAPSVIAPDAATNKLWLRDHAGDILRATARDMMSSQSATQQSDKSMGRGHDGEESAQLNGASDVHAISMVNSGFDLIRVVAEYRALRASVVRLWRGGRAHVDVNDLDDLTRFNESIDQSLTAAVGSFTERVDHSREMFLAILGHDLRNPLNSISMSAELLLHLNQPAQISKAASQISVSSAAMARMIGELLDYTRTRLGAGMPTSPETMDLQRLCQEVVDEFRTAHPALRLDYRPEGNLTGEWDTARLRQVASNLLANAIQHGAQSGLVDLAIRVEGSDVVMTVCNEGIPIPAELLPTIFDPLVRDMSPEAQKRRRPGSIGLGLYIAREIVNAHGGTIAVNSSAKTGTVFTVRLPRHQPKN